MYIIILDHILESSLSHEAKFSHKALSINKSMYVMNTTQMNHTCLLQ